MKTKILSIFLLILFFSSVQAQKTSKETWNRILNTAQVEWSEVYDKCPNFPKDNMNQAAFSKAVAIWSNNFPSEVLHFYAIERIKAINPSPYYLGLPISKSPKFDNSFIQWVKESKITDRRLMEIAPHFPNTESSNDIFEFNFIRWKSLYGHEYENIINAKELTSLNPYYDKYIDASQIPHFIGALESIDKPITPQNITKEEKLVYELRTMNWFFVFDNKNFKKEYGFYPEFPDFFNVERYKSAITEKITETKRQQSLGNFETH